MTRNDRLGGGLDRGRRRARAVVDELEQRVGEQLEPGPGGGLAACLHGRQQRSDS